MIHPTFTIKLEKTASAKRKDGSFPVVLRVIYQRNQRRVRLGVYAEPHQLVKEKLIGLRDVDKKNEILQRCKTAAIKAYEDFFEGQDFDYTRWRFLYEKELELEEAKKVKRNIGVLEYCTLVYDEKMGMGKVKSAYDYKNLRSILSKYMDGREVYFYELKKEHGKKWLKGFERYMTDNGLKGVNYMRLFKSLYTKAESGYIDDVGYLIEEFSDTPFKGVWNPRGYDFSHLRKNTSQRVNTNRIKSLSADYLTKILEYKPLKGSKEEYYLALWKFGYFMSGVNFKDVALLKWTDIKDGKWYYKRSKTAVGLVAGKPIPEYALAIIEKYGNPKKKYVFDVLNGGWDKDEETLVKRVDYYNGYIWKCAKRVSKKLNLDGYFTPYSGRHSAINIALSSGMDTNTVRTAVDQKSLSAIDSYISDSETQKLKDLMKSLVVTESVVI